MPLLTSAATYESEWVEPCEWDDGVESAVGVGVGVGCLGLAGEALLGGSAIVGVVVVSRPSLSDQEIVMVFV